MSNIKTSCGKCIFRLNSKNGNQNGCQLGRLEKFQSFGVVEKLDDYFIINRFCNACRDTGFTKESIMKEIELSCTIIVDGLKEDYWHILKSVLKQTIKPKKVFIAIDSIFNMENYKTYQELFNNNGISLLFKKFYQGQDFLQAVDDIVRKCETQYYIPINSKIDSGLIEKFNNMINIDLKRVNAYLTKDYYDSFISVYLHKVLHGNYNFPINEKIKEFEETVPEEQKGTIIYE